MLKYVHDPIFPILSVLLGIVRLRREFDLKTRKFVPGGFQLPHGKQRVNWQDKDTLLVARDWGNGAMTKSGYPFVRISHQSCPNTEEVCAVLPTNVLPTDEPNIGFIVERSGLQ
jgi:hypothetical protein